MRDLWQDIYGHEPEAEILPRRMAGRKVCLSQRNGGAVMSMPIFTKVHCTGYLRKAHDGICMVAYNKHGLPVRDLNDAKKILAVKMNLDDSGYNNQEILADLSECVGDSVHKVYRERVAEEYDGFLVGYTRINCEGEIGTDMDYSLTDTDGNVEEYYHFFKRVTYKPKVGVVYYRNNSKRYVLAEDIFYE